MSRASCSRALLLAVVFLSASAAAWSGWTEAAWTTNAQRLATNIPVSARVGSNRYEVAMPVVSNAVGGWVTNWATNRFAFWHPVYPDTNLPWGAVVYSQSWRQLVAVPSQVLGIATSFVVEVPVFYALHAVSVSGGVAEIRAAEASAAVRERRAVAGYDPRFLWDPMLYRQHRDLLVEAKQALGDQSPPTTFAGAWVTNVLGYPSFTFRADPLTMAAALTNARLPANWLALTPWRYGWKPTLLVTNEWVLQGAATGLVTAVFLTSCGGLVSFSGTNGQRVSYVCTNGETALNYLYNGTAEPVTATVWSACGGYVTAVLPPGWTTNACTNWLHQGYQGDDYLWSGVRPLVSQMTHTVVWASPSDCGTTGGSTFVYYWGPVSYTGAGSAAEAVAVLESLAATSLVVVATQTWPYAYRTFSDARSVGLQTTYRSRTGFGTNCTDATADLAAAAWSTSTTACGTAPPTGGCEEIYLPVTDYQTNITVVTMTQLVYSAYATPCGYYVDVVHDGLSGTVWTVACTSWVSGGVFEMLTNFVTNTFSTLVSQQFVDCTGGVAVATGYHGQLVTNVCEGWVVIDPGSPQGALATEVEVLGVTTCSVSGAATLYAERGVAGLRAMGPTGVPHVGAAVLYGGTRLTPATATPDPAWGLPSGLTWFWQWATPTSRPFGQLASNATGVRIAWSAETNWVAVYAPTSWPLRLQATNGSTVTVATVTAWHAGLTNAGPVSVTSTVCGVDWTNGLTTVIPWVGSTAATLRADFITEAPAVVDWSGTSNGLRYR